MGRPKGIISKTHHIWTKEEKDYLFKITPGRYHQDILKLMNENFEYQFTLGQIKGILKRHKITSNVSGQFYKGCKSWNEGTKGLTSANSGSFKKGNRPKNYKPVGTERLNADGYTEVKVGDPSVWKLKQRLIWEQYNGPIPQGSSVLFANGDKLNFDIDNLILVTRKQLLTLNQHGLIQQDAELTKVGVNVANVISKINEVKKIK